MSNVDELYAALLGAMPDREEYDRKLAVLILALRELLPEGVTIATAMIEVERSDGKRLTLGPIRNVTGQ